MLSGQSKHALKLISPISQTSKKSTLLGELLGKTLMNSATSSSRRTMVSSDYNKFREILSNSRHVVAITGAGISAESGWFEVIIHF